MPYEPPCGGGGDCAHRYRPTGAGEIACMQCGHRSKESDHEWSNHPVRICRDCYAILMRP
jgi:hypothetical protein